MKTTEIPYIRDFIEGIAEKCQPEMTVTLSSHQWTLLLREMEDHMNIYNRDQNTNKKLFELIGSQLSGKPVTIVMSEKMPEPEVVSDKVTDKKWWHRMMMR